MTSPSSGTGDGRPWNPQPGEPNPPMQSGQQGGPLWGQQQSGGSGHQTQPGYGSPPPFYGQAPKKKRGRGTFVAATILFVLSLFVGLIGGLGLSRDGGKAVGGITKFVGKSGIAPGSVAIDAEANSSYTVIGDFLSVRTTVPGKAPIATIRPEDVEVVWVGVGSDPGRVDVRESGGDRSSTTLRQGKNGESDNIGAAEFDIVQPGKYEVSVKAPAGAHFRVSNTGGDSLNDNGSAIGRTFGWVALLGFAGFLFVVGLIIGIIGLVTRSS